MKISVEATPLFQNRNIPRAGIAQYVYQVVARMITKFPDDHYTLFANKFGGGEVSEQLRRENTSRRVVKYVPGKAWGLASRKNLLPPLEFFMSQDQDVYWFTNFRTYSTLRKRKRITTIYDVAFSIYPEYIQAKNLAYLRDQVPRSLRLADRVITISDSAKHDLVTKFHAHPEKVIVAPCGVDTAFFRPTKHATAIGELGITGNYLLFVGTIEPRKNLTRIIKAYDALPKSYKDEYSLVLVGGKGWNDGEIQAEIARPRTSGRVILTGYVKDSVIPALYSQATAVLYPSLYEGFGLPIIEGLACGTPVITAKNSSLGEVAGKAALYVDEFSVQAISQGIRKLLDSETLQKQIVKAGAERVKKYTWDATADIIHRELTA